MENKNGGSAFSCECAKCGRTLYEGEILNIAGKYVCEPCADSCIFGAGTADKLRRKSAPSPFFHFIFSLHPGAGQMYLGLMKRGLLQMCLFYLSIFLVSSSNFVGIVIPIIFFYSFFDSLALRRKIAAGEYVTDDLNGLTSFISRNKGLVIIAVSIMLLILSLSMAVGSFKSYTSAPVAKNYEVIVTQPAVPAVPAVPSPPSPPQLAVQPAQPVPYVVERAEYFGRHRVTAGVLAPALLIGVGALIILKSGKRRKADDKADDMN